MVVGWCVRIGEGERGSKKGFRRYLLFIIKILKFRWYIDIRFYGKENVWEYEFIDNVYRNLGIIKLCFKNMDIFLF